MTRQLLRLLWLGPAASPTQIFPRGPDRSHISSRDRPSRSTVARLCRVIREVTWESLFARH